MDSIQVSASFVFRTFIFPLLASHLFLIPENSDIFWILYFTIWSTRSYPILMLKSPFLNVREILGSQEPEMRFTCPSWWFRGSWRWFLTNSQLYLALGTGSQSLRILGTYWETALGTQTHCEPYSGILHFASLQTKFSMRARMLMMLLESRLPMFALSLPKNSHQISSCRRIRVY